jgi:hypothetical protein
MMTEQELNNLMRAKAQTSIPSIIQEIMRLTQSLDEKARELASLMVQRPKTAKPARSASTDTPAEVQSLKRVQQCCRALQFAANGFRQCFLGHIAHVRTHRSLK